jgi:hypothetical protein
MTTARLSSLSIKGERGARYKCKFVWPNDCFVQCGDHGTVLSKKGSYQTAFFEAFPSNPDTFIRGEGESIEEAEAAAWGEYRKYQACSEHEYERRGYKNGAGLCKHCNMFKSKVFEPSEKCIICDTPCYWDSDKKGNWYCEKHNDQNPDKLVW